MKKRGYKRKGGFTKRLTSGAKQYILVYIDVANNETRTLGIYPSLDTAKQELDQHLQMGRSGMFHILSNTNRVLYSRKGEE